MNLLPSVLRTIVPLIVGVLITLALKAGLNIDSAAVTPWVTTLVTAVYYIVVRFLETNASAQFGWLLGLASQPVYVPPVGNTPSDATPVTAYADEPTLVNEATGGAEL